MQAVWRGLRRFSIVTLGAAVRALNLLGWRGLYPRAGTGIEAWRKACPLPPLMGEGLGMGVTEVQDVARSV